MKKGFLLFVLMFGLAGGVSGQTKILKPTLQKSEHFQSTIALVYPNGGETVFQGSRQTIQWKVRGTAPAIRIELLRYGKLFQTIVEEYPGAKGTVVWTVGKVQAGDGYTVRLISVNNDLFDASDQPFTITSPATGTASLPQQQGTGLAGQKPSRRLNKTGSKSDSSGSGQWWQNRSSSHETDQESEERSSPYQINTGQQGGILSADTATLPSASVRSPSAQQRETVSLTGAQDRGMSLEGAPPPQGAFVQRIVDLHFTSPEGGEVWVKGRTYTIRWDKVGGIGNVKILLKDLMNQSSLWVSTGQDHVIQNTGYYSFSVTATLADSAFEFHIMTPDESYTSKSKRFYIHSTDTDLSVKAVNFTRRKEYVGPKKMYLKMRIYVFSELWLKNKGSKRLNAVAVTWKIVREPSGRVVRQGEKIFENLTPDTWYQQDLKECYYNEGKSGFENNHIWGTLQPGEKFVLILYADLDNDLGESEYTQDDNTYQTEVVDASNYWGQ